MNTHPSIQIQARWRWVCHCCNCQLPLGGREAGGAGFLTILLLHTGVSSMHQRLTPNQATQISPTIRLIWRRESYSSGSARRLSVIFPVSALPCPFPAEPHFPRIVFCVFLGSRRTFRLTLRLMLPNGLAMLLFGLASQSVSVRSAVCPRWRPLRRGTPTPRRRPAPS